MHTTDNRTMKRGMIAAILSLLMVWALGSTAQAQTDNSLHVNVGESITLTVDGFTKLAIADPLVGDVVPLSSKEISVIGKKMGVTTLTVIIPDKPTQVYRVEVGNDLVAVLIHKVVNSPNVTVRTVGDTVILDGYVNDELDAQRAAAVVAAIKGQQVLNLIEVRHPRQVRIRTRIAEVNSDAVKNIGLQWFGPAGQVQYAMQFIGNGSIVHGFIPTASEFGSEGGTVEPNTVTMTALLDLLITKDYARLLSEPTLTTLSGKEASFLVGEEVPIVQQLPQSFTVEFKEVGVRMKVKPTVDSQNQINTTIHAEVSLVTGTGALGIPIIGTKQSDTQLQVKDGQTIVIGGLLENNVSRDYFRWD
jgi:pilus assembly protein CpaC